MKKTIEYIDPYLAKDKPGYSYGDAPSIRAGITDPDAVELWKTVMRQVRKTENGKKKIVLNAPVTASRLLADKIVEFMEDEEHIYYAFEGEKPKAKDIYEAARFSKSTWGRIMTGELSDLERGNVFAIALALRLNENQTVELLHSAGFSLNYEIELDAAVMYFIKKEERDLDKVWRVLGQFCNVKNGLDCFVFHPQKENQLPDRLRK